jgi:hypothetical protein
LLHLLLLDLLLLLAFGLTHVILLILDLPLLFTLLLIDLLLLLPFHAALLVQLLAYITLSTVVGFTAWGLITRVGANAHAQKTQPRQAPDTGSHACLATARVDVD